MTPLEHALAAAFAHYQAGRLAEAGAALRPHAAAGRDDPRYAAMAGQLALRLGDAAAAAHHLARALAAAPGNVELRTQLAFAHLARGAYDDARRTVGAATAMPLRRVLAFVDQRQGRADAAIAGYRAVLAAFPRDPESWHNLGLLLAERDDPAPALDALTRATALAPGDPQPPLHLAQLLARLDRRAERRDVLRAAVARHPADGALRAALGDAEFAGGDHRAAERVFLIALAASPPPAGAVLEYGMMLERLNRLDDLATLLDGHGGDAPPAETGLLRATLLFRRGRHAEAAAALRGADPATAPIRHARLSAQLADAAGDAAGAFAAFARMNAIAAAEPSSRAALAIDFPADVAAAADAARAGGGEAVPEPPGVGEQAWRPIFLLGFPRSGTTLLDTMLMNVPTLAVLEEVPVLERLWEELADPRAVAALSADAVRGLRARYRALVDAALAGRSGRLVLDKFPLNMVRAPLLHRLFPDAPILAAERHPCDVVLSCFMARFENNRAMVHFQTLEGAARLYDAAMRAWTLARERLPLRVHPVRYEALVADPTATLRAAAAFLGIAWRADLADNVGSAARRDHIATASYAQVGRPIDGRAVNRWERYRAQMAPVLPILAPWAERLGYAM